MDEGLVPMVFLRQNDLFALLGDVRPHRPHPLLLLRHLFRKETVISRPYDLWRRTP